MAGELTCDVPVVDVDATITRVAVLNIKCSNPSVASAITVGTASYVLTYRCGATFLRDVALGQGDRIDKRFPNGSLYGRVELTLQACLRSREHWRPEGLHEDYGKETFLLEPGSVIALGPSFSFEVADDFDPLSGSVASLFSVIRTDQKTAPARVLLESGGRIQILLSQLEHDQFNASRNRIPGLIHAGLVYPALVEAITRVATPESGDEDKLWHQRLGALLDQRQCDASSPFTAASTILSRPFERASLDVANILTSEEDE